ncbi:hypothetical protein HZC33_01265 [Candidatus Wolfebacteria bacterium]|nr:hypothetical protein [Candidatus Wolfebacteria bacterium]
MKKQKIKKSKMTLDKLALIIKQEIDTKVSKDDLKNELQRFATKDDLKNELQRFVTKDDLKNFKIEFKSEVADEIKSTIKEELTDNINKLFTKADIIISKLEKKEQEDLMHTQAHRRINDTLEIHDKKIKNLEIKIN